MTMVPMGGNKISPNPWLMDHYPDAYINMGLSAENIAQEIRHHARTSGCVFAGKPSQSAGRNRRGKIQR